MGVLGRILATERAGARGGEGEDHGGFERVGSIGGSTGNSF